ncbi:aspartate/glutamate racemase family protein [Deferribacteraceae bacterium V6Fe1]|nr:aspartate/glutamate racemase family protein [Deferribacteraceae bacterium V6Fe1]
MSSGKNARIGILCWEAGQSPRGLEQLEYLKGNSTNPETYNFPVMFRRVEGANIHTILENPDHDIMKKMIEEAKEMVEKGVKAITTSCGFNAIFQREMAEALNVPVFTSSLLQIPFISNMFGKNKTIAVITAKKRALKEEHLHAVGISSDISLSIYGMEECHEWNKIFEAPQEDVNLDIIEKEVIGTALKAINENQNISALVLECTDLPPFAESIRKVTDKPVFDFVTMVNYINSAI